MTKLKTKIFLLGLFLLLLLPQIILAAEPTKNIGDTCNPMNNECIHGDCVDLEGGNDFRCRLFEPQVKIPGIDYNAIQPSDSLAPIGNYIKGIYNYAIGIVAIFATIFFLMGGFMWILAGGNAEKVGEAKSYLTASVAGLILAFASYSILSFVNPALVSFKSSKIDSVKTRSQKCCMTDGTLGKQDPDTKECLDKSGSCDVYCSFQKNGTTCADDGYCINKKCWYGYGYINEPCGVNGISQCLDGTMGCPTGWYGEHIGGRDCMSGLYCCYHL